MTDEQSPLDLIETFVDTINRHEVDGIVRLLHPDHVFTDSLGRTVRGAESMRAAWQDYFAIVPDYWIRVEHGVLAPEYIALFGEAGGTLAVAGQLREESKWQSPAAWRAVVIDGQVAEWEVYADNEPLRALMRKQR
jgi:ketosteroid isomerase-like protein